MQMAAPQLAMSRISGARRVSTVQDVFSLQIRMHMEIVPLTGRLCTMIFGMSYIGVLLFAHQNLSAPASDERGINTLLRPSRWLVIALCDFLVAEGGRSVPGNLQLDRASDGALLGLSKHVEALRSSEMCAELVRWWKFHEVLAEKITRMRMR